MKKYPIHLCMVSGQPLPNLIPLLDSSMRPEKVLLLVSRDMQRQSERLRQVMQQHGCQVMDDVPVMPYDVDDIRQVVQQQIEMYQASGIALNVTGGTKPMALMANELFSRAGLPVFYVDTDNGNYITLSPQTGAVKLPDIVDIRSYLICYGYSINEHKTAEKQPPVRKQETVRLLQDLVNRTTRFENALTIMNRYASQATGALEVLVDLKHTRINQFMELVRLFSTYGLLRFEQNRIRFADEGARFFVNGGWLEEYVADQLRQLKETGEICDYASNLVVNTATGVENELDAVFTSKNRLNLIECKTKRFDDRAHKADDTAFKLETLKEVMGGTFGKAMLVTFRKLGEKDRERCKEYRIRVVEGEQLKNLKNILKNWIKPRN